jgi:hypothetical protein
MELKIFYVQPTQGEEKDTDEQVKSRSDLDELLGMSTTSMDFDVASVEGEGQLQAYIQVQQVPNDTDPLMWWKQHQQEFPDLARMARQYLAVPATSASPERFFSRVGLVQTDLRKKNGGGGGAPRCPHSFARRAPEEPRLTGAALYCSQVWE